MSILIKGMEMPKDGCHHMICIYADGTVSTGGRVYMAVPVPPHGRLIDADAFFKDICNSIENMTKLGVGVDADFLWAKLNDALDNAPTVIPADKDGET